MILGLDKKDFNTIPNYMSLFRLLLIPVIAVLYCKEQMYFAATVALLISGLTDILDGIIARRFKMVSDIGKILDPVADKLTQGAVIICLATRYRKLWIMIALFIIKELVMAFVGCVVIHRTDTVNSAKWYGKACTVILEFSLCIMILFVNIPKILVDILFVLCCTAMVCSLILYMRFYSKLLKETRVSETE